jgi:hypothetical protein
MAGRIDKVMGDGLEKEKLERFHNAGWVIPHSGIVTPKAE